MGRAPSKTRRVVFWVLVVLGGLLLLLFAALGAAGWWLEHRYLRGELRFGPGGETSVRVHGARFEWLALDLHADSAIFRSPSLDAYSGSFEAGVDWSGGLSSLRPSARLRADTIHLRLRADTAEKKPLDPDSLTFPDFSLPLGVSLRVKRLMAADDSGFLASADGLSARGWGRKARARASAVRTRWTDTLAFSVRASLDASSPDFVRARASAQRDSDHVTLRALHARSPLWRGSDSIEARVRDAAPYLAAFGLRDRFPEITEVALTGRAAFADTSAFAARLEGKSGAYRVGDALTVGPQTVGLSARWRGRRGSAALRSAGPEGEAVSLDVEARLLPARAEADAPLAERIALSLRGRATGFRVTVRDTLRRADLVVERADWDGGRLALVAATGDSSRVRGDADLRGPATAWKGTFALTLAPEERWVKAFAGDAVSFRALEARGEYARRTLTAEAAARGLEAYGVTLDSLRSFHAYDVSGSSGYVLKPSRLHARGIEWTLSGAFRPASRPGRSAVFSAELSANGHGRLRVSGERDGTLRAQAGLFDVGALPYAPIDSLPLGKPVLDGTFAWNPARRTGAADLSAQADYRREQVEARIKGEWDSRLLRIDDVAGKVRNSELHASAVIRLKGKQFWELHRVPPADYERVAIRIPGLDLPEVLALALPESPLESGGLSGSLSYADSVGFGGSLTFAKVVPREAVGDVTLKELRLDGAGDTLTITARSGSESVPLYNAALTAKVTGALKEEQRIAADLIAGDSLRARLDAVTKRFRAFKGSLAVSGRASLPENSGALSDIRIGVDFDVPAVDPGRKAVASTRAFEVVYAPPEVERQRITLAAALRDGVLRVDTLRVKGEGRGGSLAGSLEYGLESGALRARLQGDRFAAQWGKAYKADLRALKLEVTRDEKGLRATGGFDEGTFLYADAPLRAEGRLTRVEASYASPPARARTARGARPPADLTLNATLEQSLIRYRLRSLADIQRVFRRESRRPSSGPPLRLNVRVRTLGSKNRIDSDILRLAWVGDLTVRGTHPYTLFNGRVNGVSGDFGLERQSYDIGRLEVKWLNEPSEEGEVRMEANKKLASDCSRTSDGDSCTVILRLAGDLTDPQLTYDSDCGGAFGAGASVAGMLLSVQRGCYDPALASGADGPGYGSRALTLIESPLSGELSRLFGRYSASWIEQAEITGLGSLAGEDVGPDSIGQALSLGLTSREYLRFRLKIRSGYHTASQDLSNPWEHMLALEWRTPADALATSPEWKRRLRDNLRVVGSLETRPVLRNNPEEDEVEKKIGLNYTYGFWGAWWSQPRRPKSSPAPAEVEARADGNAEDAP